MATRKKDTLILNNKFVVKIRSVESNNSNLKNEAEDSENKINFSFTKRLKHKFKDKKKEHFFSELSTLISSGIDVYTSIKLMRNEAVDKLELETLSILIDHMVDGGSLNHSMKKSGVFSKYDVESVRVGEETGLLNVIMLQLSDYYHRKILQKKVIIKAITYPSIVLATALLAMVFMLSYVVPMFEDIFLRSNNELPKFTMVLISISQFFRESFGYFVLVLILLTISVVILIKNTSLLDHLLKLIFKIPFVGVFVRLFYFEKVFHSLFLLTKAKIPLQESLCFVADIINFRPINAYIKLVRESIKKGETLSFSLKIRDYLDTKTIMLIGIGEEVNKLDDVFEKVYNRISKELEYKLDQATTLLEPFLIIFVGGLVAIILVAMYLPLFRMGTSVF